MLKKKFENEIDENDHRNKYITIYQNDVTFFYVERQVYCSK